MIVGTAGHVDHGKSTLVRLLTGTDPDRWEEEKRRGLTIDLGFATTTLPSGRLLGFVDVPGHERFVKNMLAGAGGIDVALFVVAGDEGWMPQSEEHLQILDVLGIRHGVVAMTRCDLADPETLDVCELEIEDALAGTGLEGTRVVRTSSNEPATLAVLREALDDVCGEAEEHARGRDARQPVPRPRLWIDRAFTVDGAGTVVTGTLTGGPLHRDESVSIGSQQLRIRSLQVHGHRTGTAPPRHRVACNVVGDVRPDSIARGDAVTVATEPAQFAWGERLQVWLRQVRTIARPLGHRGAWHLHVGTLHVPARLRLLGEAVPVDGGASTAAELNGAATDPGVFGRLYLPRAVGPLGIGDRFVLRDESDDTTAAGGIVLSVVGPNLPPAELGARLRALDSGPEALGRRLVEEAGGVIAAGTLVAGIGTATVPGVVVAGPWAFAEEEFATRRDDLLARTRAAARSGERLPLERDPVTREIAASLSDEGMVELRDGTLGTPESGDRLDRRQAEAAAVVEVACREAGARPLTETEASVSAGSTALVSRLVQSGRLVRLGPYVTVPEVRDDLVARVLDRLSTGPATTSELREALGTSRKWAIPMLEEFDRIGLTERDGDHRTPGVRSRR